MPKLNRFQETLLDREALYRYEAGVGGFTRYYLGQKPEITKDFVADDTVIYELRRYLDKEDIRYTEVDLAANLTWVQRRIKREVFTSMFGLTEGYKVELEDDPQVLKAVEALPEARALYDNAKKIVAQRMNGQPGPR